MIMKAITKKWIELIVAATILYWIVSGSDDRQLLIGCAIGIIVLLFKDTIRDEFKKAREDDRPNYSP